MKYFAKVGDREYECVLDADNGALSLTIGGRTVRADLVHLERAHTYSLLLDGKSYEFAVHEGDEAIELSGAAGLFHVTVEDARTHAARAKTGAARADHGPKVLKAAMPGIVREVCVADGDAVEKAAPLLILEAMKMQNEIRSDRAGRITRVHVAAGDTVDKGAPLVEIA